MGMRRTLFATIALHPMRAFQIHLNGKRLCTAGVGEDGVLTAVVRSILRPRQVSKQKRSSRSKEDLAIDVGGLISPTLEHLRWKTPRLRSGDEICIKIIETDSADKPNERKRAAPELESAKKKYVERTAKSLGWKIVKPPPSRKRQ
jgi:hypothetical protein